MKKRLYVLLLAGVLTFNQTGMVVLAEDAEVTQQTESSAEGLQDVPVMGENEQAEPKAGEEQSVTVSPESASIGAEGGQIKFEVSEGGLS